MLNFLLKKVGFLILSMLVVSIILFLALEVSGDNVATKVLGQFSTLEQRQLWLEENGYNRPLAIRYSNWLSRFVVGDFGYSYRYKVEVAPLLKKRFLNTSVLALTTLLIVSILSLVLGTYAGLKEGKFVDKGISFIFILTSSIPEFASSIFLSALFVYYLEWFPGVSNLSFGFNFKEMFLPVAVLTLYSFGYVGRMTRSAVCEVRTSAYVRTAHLKGLPSWKVTFSYIVKNSLITPITVIFLQLPWLLSGVIVVEFFFAYKGFGALLLEASLNDDIYLIEACAMVSVVVVFLSQLFADLFYLYLNPKMRFK